MKFSALPILFATAVSASVQGFDISGWQPSVDFAGAYASGARFVMIKVRDVHGAQLYCLPTNHTRLLRAPPSSPALSRASTLVPLMPV